MRSDRSTVVVRGKAMLASGVVVLTLLLGSTRPATAATTTAPTSSATTSTTAGAATSTSTTVGSATSTTVKPEQCEPVAPLTVTFLGRATVHDDQVVQFTVLEARSGPISVGETLAVVYPRDARFFHPGSTYLVAATTDPQSRLLLSKVRAKRGEDPRCTAKDPVVTRRPDGSAVETGILSGMNGRWRHAAWLIVMPLLAVLAALTVLVLVRRTLWAVGRTLRRVRAD